MSRPDLAGLGPDDLAEAEGLLARTLGSRHQARLGEVIDVLATTGLVARDDTTGLVGIATYRQAGAAVELTALAADPPRLGVGSALVEALVDRVAGAERIWVVTTNDNLDALRFYQRRGFRLVGLEVGGVDRARALKPSIPAIGAHGIPLRDELVLERRLH